MSNTFGNNLKKYRNEKKIGLNELGRKIGVSGAYLSALERGKKQNPSLDIISKLSHALDIPPSFLTSEKDMLSPENLLNSAALANSEVLFFKSLGYEMQLLKDKNNGYAKIDNIEYTYSQFISLKNLIISCIDNMTAAIKENNKIE